MKNLVANQTADLRKLLIGILIEYLKTNGRTRSIDLFRFLNEVHGIDCITNSIHGLPLCRLLEYEPNVKWTRKVDSPDKKAYYEYVA